MRSRWPAELRQPLFVAGAGLYVVLQGNRRLVQVPLPSLLNSYLADVLALPLLLTLALWYMRRVYFRKPGFVLPGSWVFSTWLAVVVGFELLLPIWRPTATPDPWDAAAYAVGGLVFWRWMNRPAHA
ncbi:hypothetical protein [Hymenobacter tenuis]